MSGLDGVVLVTGATGFVGSHVVEQLLADGVDVHAMARRPPDRAIAAPWHEADLRDRAAVEGVLGEVAPRVVIDLAGPSLTGGRAPGEGSATPPAPLLHAAAAAGVGRVVRAGDAFECASTGRPLRADAGRPSDAWGRARRAATEEAHAAGAAVGIEVVTLRLFSVYGRHDHPQRLMPTLVHAARSGEPAHLSRPDVVRDWTHVHDIATAFASAADCPRLTGVLHVGTGVATTSEQLVALVESAAGRAIDARWGTYPDAPQDDGWWVADPDPAMQRLGWSPRPLSSGLAELVAA